jgi:hypothetical protein
MAGDEGTKQPTGLAEPAPHFHGHRERLRARFLQGGSDALADYELLELVLFRAIARRDLKPLAKNLIKQFGSFAEVVSAPIERLKSIKGLGEAAITELKISLTIVYEGLQEFFCILIQWLNQLQAGARAPPPGQCPQSNFTSPTVVTDPHDPPWAVLPRGLVFHLPSMASNTRRT